MHGFHAMPILLTRDFGEMEFAPDAFLSFPAGIPGFELEKRFVLIEPPLLAPALVLQSATTPDLSFLVIPVSVVDTEYRIGITLEDLRILGLDETRQPSAGEVRVLGIVSATDGGHLTTNLLAPVVICIQTRIGAQAVRNDAVYSHGHPIHIETGSSEGESSCS